MMRKTALAISFVLVGACIGLAQSDPGVVIAVETRNYVIYWDDIGDPSKFATEQRMTPARRPANFDRGMGVGDIVSVNGSPAKGTFNYVANILAMNSIPTPGQALVDSQSRGATLLISYDIQDADGTQVGTIWAAGFAGAVPPPGVPAAGLGQNLAIIGGTGAFLGARGQINGMMTTSRAASVIEDPANRQAFGGGTRRDSIHLLPAERPAVRAVFHNDLSPVNPANPAAKGELLIIEATGMGPVRAILEPGQQFPESPLAEINSPVKLTVNGEAVDVARKVGWAGRAGVYRLEFRVPDTAASGEAVIRLSSAWVLSQPVTIPTRD